MTKKLRGMPYFPVIDTLMNQDGTIVHVVTPPLEEEFTVIGPECFVAADGSVLSWRGVNYVPQAGATGATGDVDHLLGFDVNEFESTQVYAIFNDAQDPDLAGLPEAIRSQLLDVPLMEDESLRRVADHARLMNEDRDRLRPPRGHVKVRVQTILKTPYRDVEL